MNDLAGQLPSIDASAALQSFIAFGVVIACVVLCGFAGFRIKLFAAIASCAAFVASSIAAFVWGEACGRLIGAFGIAAHWQLVVGFTAVFLTFFLFVKLLLRGVARVEVMTYPAIIDRVGGVVVGMVAGLFLASIVRVGLAMAPVTSRVRPTPEQIQADITPRVLQMMSRIMSGDVNVRRDWLRGVEGQPFEGQAAPGQVVLSEPFVDENGNNQRDRDELFLDKDGNGEFTASLLITDKALNPDLRVGAMDRYWLGNWQRVTVEVR
jgi:hypothetical protein